MGSRFLSVFFGGEWADYSLELLPWVGVGVGVGNATSFPGSLILTPGASEERPW